MQPSLKIINQSTNWKANLRLKVGDTVIFDDSYWVNVAGSNSEPYIGNPDWIYISSSSPLRRKKTKLVTGLTYTIQADDAIKKLQFENTETQTVYIDADFQECDFECVQYGVGKILILPAVGTSIEIKTCPSEFAGTSEQYSKFIIEWQRENVYLVYGRIDQI